MSLRNPTSRDGRWQFRPILVCTCVCVFLRRVRVRELEFRRAQSMEALLKARPGAAVCREWASAGGHQRPLAAGAGAQAGSLHRSLTLINVAKL